MSTGTSFRIFYSWQTDSPSQTNRFAIKKALSIASSKIMAARPECTVTIDEATRDIPGSPNIANTILEKIEASDIMVADVTTITQPGVSRPCPNPNVTFELGFAVSTLGWYRIVMLFNEALGSFPKDLPFDFLQHRTEKYNYSESTTNSTDAGLAKALERAIVAIVDTNPKRPDELRGWSRERIERVRDIDNLQWFFSTIHIPTLDEYILDIPYKKTERSFWFWEGFHGLISNSLFHIYDPDLRQAIAEFSTSWATTMSHSEEYTAIRDGNAYVFSSPGDSPLSDQRQEAWDQIKSARIPMRRALDDILRIVREKYIEIDITATNKKAWKQYVDFHRKMEEIMSRSSRNQ